jgi:hypothetical protein
MTPGRPSGPAVETTARHRRSSGRAAGGTHRKPAALPNPSPRVRLPEVIIGVFLVAGSALGALVWHSSNSATTPALVLAADVQRGHVFTAGDFAAASVRSEGVRLIRFADREKMIGRIAAVDLRIADPITETVAVTLLPIDTDQALISRRLEAGEFPDAIAPGSTVRIVIVDADPSPSSGASADPAAPGAAPSELSTDSIIATVEDVRPGETSADTVILTLRLLNVYADAVASAPEIRLVQVRG